MSAVRRCTRLCGNQPVCRVPMTRPSWLVRAARNRHRHAIEQASRRWRGGRRDDSARTHRKILISTQVAGPSEDGGQRLRAVRLGLDGLRRRPRARAEFDSRPFTKHVLPLGAEPQEGRALVARGLPQKVRRAVDSGTPPPSLSIRYRREPTGASHVALMASNLTRSTPRSARLLRPCQCV